MASQTTFFRPVGQSVGRRSVSRLVGRSKVVRSVSRSVGRSKVGWSVGRSVGRSKVGWSVGRSFGRLISWGLISRWSNLCTNIWSKVLVSYMSNASHESSIRERHLYDDFFLCVFQALWTRVPENFVIWFQCCYVRIGTKTWCKDSKRPQIWTCHHVWTFRTKGDGGYR